MVFCNLDEEIPDSEYGLVTILILIDGFLQLINMSNQLRHRWVTILILIDGFLQLDLKKCLNNLQNGHNPYFNRWFSAITIL